MSKEKVFLSGYALTYGTAYVYGNFIEIIERGALDEANMTDVLALLDHNSSKLLGRSSSGTLTLKSDNTGLFFRVEVPATGLGAEVATLVARGDLRQCSWGFSLAKDGEKWDYSPNGLPVRRITKVGRVFDITVTACPANDKTSVYVESIAAAIGTRSDDRAQMDAELEQASMQADLLNARIKADRAKEDHENWKRNMSRPNEITAALAALERQYGLR